MSKENLEAVQAVVDRVSSYQESAPTGTVDKELRDSLGEAGVEISDDQLGKLVAAIESGDGHVSAEDVLT